MKKIILILIIIAIGYFGYQQFNSMQALEYLKIEHVKLSNLTGPPDFKVQLDADTYWNNPNSVGTNIVSMDFDVLIDKQFVTKIDKKVNVEVPANDVFMLPISINVPLLKGKLLRNVSELLTGAWKNKSVDVHLKGIVKVKSLKVTVPIPFSIHTTIKLSDYF